MTVTETPNYITVLVPDCILRGGITEIGGKPIRRERIGRNPLNCIVVGRGEAESYKAAIDEVFDVLQLGRKQTEREHNPLAAGAVPIRERGTGRMRKPRYQ